jgi:hypothetical protein
MDMMQFGSLNSYLKQTKRKTQWDLKKESGTYAAHVKSLEAWFGGQREDAEPDSASGNSSAGDIRFQFIQQKVYSGKPLTYNEKSYLRQKDPVTYGKVQAMEQEQRRYERALRRCQTKEEVQRLKMAQMSDSLAELKASEDDPGMVSLISAKVSALERITQRFIRRSSYQALPTDAEKAEAERELREAAAAREARPEQTVEEPTEMRAEEPEGVSKADEPAEDIGDETAQELPEARKVRRSRSAAHAQWAAVGQETTAYDADGNKKVDKKA